MLDLDNSECWCCLVELCVTVPGSAGSYCLIRINMLMMWHALCVRVLVYTLCVRVLVYTLCVRVLVYTLCVSVGVAWLNCVSLYQVVQVVTVSYASIC